MARSKNTLKLWKLMALGVVFGGAGAIAFSENSISPKTPAGSSDPTATELINQARGLQKLGRWHAAIEILAPLAQDGHLIALYQLGRAYKNGWGVPADLTQARLIFLETVRYSFAYRGETAYELGRLFQRSAGDDCARIALEWFHKALEWDYPKAHVQLAKHYERAIGTERDLDRSFHHYEQAAIAGYPSSTINYARILKSGRYGTAPDREQAEYWAERAMEGLEKKARDGSASAAKTLGRIYRDGEFVEQNDTSAEDWFLRSATLGDAGAMHDLARLKLSGTPDKHAVTVALDWLKIAANAEHGGALTALARLHLGERHGLEPADALPLLERGVEAGHPGAMGELGRLYAKGFLVPKDLARARDLATKGAARGHIGSATLLADLEDSLNGAEPSSTTPKKTEG